MVFMAQASRQNNDERLLFQLTPPAPPISSFAAGRNALRSGESLEAIHLTARKAFQAPNRAEVQAISRLLKNLVSRHREGGESRRKKRFKGSALWQRPFSSSLTTQVLKSDVFSPAGKWQGGKQSFATLPFVSFSCYSFNSTIMTSVSVSPMFSPMCICPFIHTTLPALTSTSFF